MIHTVTYVYFIHIWHYMLLYDLGVVGVFNGTISTKSYHKGWDDGSICGLPSLHLKSNKYSHVNIQYT